MKLSCVLAIVFCALAVQGKPQGDFIERVFPKDLPKQLTPRIIGGSAASPGEIPYQIGLVASAGWFCGGSLIRPQWVLTAAHCGDGAGSVTVYLGSTSVQSGTQIRSSQIVVHPNWNSNTLNSDVSLIRLASAAPIGGNINVVQLSSSSSSLAGQAVRASGWGKDSNNAGGVARNLNKVQLSVISNSECRNYYGSTITDSSICCGGDNVHATCSGDSGGPLVLSSNGEQVGVTSFVSGNGCASIYPLGFARVSSFLSWINSQAN